MNILKSIWGVAAGFLTVDVLSTGTDWVLETIGIFPPPSDQVLFVPWWMLMLALIYNTAYTVLGGYVTAALAPSNRMRHVVILAKIGRAHV